MPFRVAILCMGLFWSLCTAAVVKAHICEAKNKLPEYSFGNRGTEALKIVKDNPEIKATLQKEHGESYTDGFDNVNGYIAWRSPTYHGSCTASYGNFEMANKTDTQGCAAAEVMPLA